MSSRTNQSGDEAAADRPRLRRSARSTRLARPIDPPYWESLGFNHHEAMNLSNFTYITTNDKTDFVAPFPHNGDNFTPFHEQLLPHWRAFAKMAVGYFEESKRQRSVVPTKSRQQVLLSFASVMKYLLIVLLTPMTDIVRLGGVGLSSGQGWFRRAPQRTEPPPSALNSSNQGQGVCLKSMPL